MLYFSHLISQEEMALLLKENEGLTCGVESIEFSISSELDRFDKAIREYKETLSYWEYPALSLHGPFVDMNPVSFDSRVRQVTMDRFHQCYEAAEILGADRIVFHTGYCPMTYMLMGWAERAIEFFNEFMEGKSGILVCLENNLDPEIIPLLQIAEEIRHPDFGICLDLGHAHCMSEYSEMEWTQRLLPYIRHLHLHDNVGDRDRHLALGEGNISTENVLRLLEKRQEAGGREFPTVTLENTSLEDFRKSISWLKEHDLLHLVTQNHHKSGNG